MTNQPEPDLNKVLEFLEEVKENNRTFTLYEVITILKHVPTLAEQEPKSKHLEGFNKLMKKFPTSEMVVRISKSACELTLQEAVKCFLDLGASNANLPIKTLDQSIVDLRAQIAEQKSESDNFSE